MSHIYKILLALLIGLVLISGISCSSSKSGRTLQILHRALLLQLRCHGRGWFPPLRTAFSVARPGGGAYSGRQPQANLPKRAASWF